MPFKTVGNEVGQEDGFGSATHLNFYHYDIGYIHVAVFTMLLRGRMNADLVWLHRRGTPLYG